MQTVSLNSRVTFGGARPFVLIAGPCVIESEREALGVAEAVNAIALRLGIPFVFKASYDKANRTSIGSFRGPGLVEGVHILASIREKIGVPILSDVHTVEEAEFAGQVLDIVQIPAFLCRQTDLIVAAARTGKVVNIKKGQFVAPWDMAGPIEKAESTGNRRLLLTERGTSFGYNTLVSDFRGLSIMRSLGYPVVFDATHSVQQPGGHGDRSGGERQHVALLSRCAAAAGIDALFLETHPNPQEARSDGASMVPLDELEALLREAVAIDRLVKGLSS